MLTRIKHTFSLVAMLALFNFAATAGLGQQQVQSSATVTAAASGNVVRVSAPGNITHIRLEVFSAVGERVFDSGPHDGNVLDWRWQDEKGQALSADSYLCVVTVQSLSGKTSRKLANVSFANQQATLKPVEITQLTPVQAQALSATETDTPLTIIDGDQTIAATVIAHDGNDGQITRTRGAFTFRVGDFFSGNDKEQMRLTEDGNLGIGTSKPKAKLDVAGTVRARGGFMFSDGSTLNVNDKGVLTRTSADGTNTVPSTTQNKIAKFTDNAGTVGDSIVLDTGSGLQLTAAPSISVDTNLLYLNSTNGTTGVLAGSTPSYGANNGPFFAMRGNSYTTIGNQRGLFTIAAGNVANPQGDDGSVKFNTGNDQLRMVIRPSGNVGINTLVPTERLHVTGNGLFTGNLTVNGTLNATLPANSISGVLPIANGGTGSSTKNFTDLTTNQTIAGDKTFTGSVGVTGAGGVFNGNGSGLTNLNGSNVTGTVANATNATQLNGVAASQYVVTTDPRMTDARSPTSGSDNYIQNRTTPQPGNFNVSGDGNIGKTLRITGNDLPDPDFPILSLSANGSFQVDAPFIQGGRFVVGNNGNVGIGNQFPTEKLDVTGNIKFSGNITGDGSGLSNVKADTTTNLSLLGSLRWDLLQPQNFSVGSGPFGVAFDGANIWVANNGSNNVTKLRASDGACVDTCTFAVGIFPFGVAFDGANIWVTNNLSNNVTKLRASDGALQGTFAVGSSPRGVAFDGANIWVANNGSSFVTKLRASDGACVGPCAFAVGSGPYGVAFDGANIWTANNGGSNVTKLRASDGACVGICTFGPFGSNPLGVAFDGANIWVANNGSSNVTKLASDGALQGTFAVGIGPVGVAFDGVNIWVANNLSNNVIKLPAFP